MLVLNIGQEELARFATWRFGLRSTIGSKFSELTPPTQKLVAVSSRNVSVSWQFYLLSERRWAKSSVSFVELEREKKKKKSHLKNKNKNISDFPRKLNR